MIRLNTVVLPAPFGPISAGAASRERTEKLKFSTTRKAAEALAHASSVRMASEALMRPLRCGSRRSAGQVAGESARR